MRLPDWLDRVVHRAPAGGVVPQLENDVPALERAEFDRFMQQAVHPLGVTTDCIAVFEAALGGLPEPDSVLHELMLVWDSTGDDMLQAAVLEAARKIDKLTPFARVPLRQVTLAHVALDPGPG